MRNTELDTGFKMKTLINISLVFLLFASCADDPCLKGSGNTIIETRELQDSIITFQVSNNLNVDVYLSDRNYVEIEGGENVIPFISVEMSDTVLLLKNNNKCNFLRNFDQNLKVRLYLKSVSRFMFDGSGTLNFMDTLKGREVLVKSLQGSGTINLTVWLDDNIGRIRISLEDGSVDVNVKGRAHYLNTYFTTTSTIDAKDLITNICGVYTESAGDIVVNAIEHINVLIYSIGDIKYRGSPTIRIENHTGSGQIMRY